MNTETLDALAARWRAESARFRELGLTQAAAMSEAHADELDAAVREWATQALDLEAAARESGYSRSRLQHLVADGDVPNAGEAGSPRIRRADLPRRPRTSAVRRLDDGRPDLAGARLSREAGG